MNDFITPAAAWCATIIEALGIGIITLIALYALIDAAVRLFRKEDKDTVFQDLRQFLGRGILLGLEFLIAVDIIYTVAVELTFETVGVLALVVLVRTFLSFTLAVELTGRWPWQDEKYRAATPALLMHGNRWALSGSPMCPGRAKLRIFEFRVIFEES